MFLKQIAHYNNWQNIGREEDTYIQEKHTYNVELYKKAIWINALGKTFQTSNN